MKRMSKAEEALRAQIKIVQGAMDECDHQIAMLTERRKTLHELRMQFDSTVIDMVKSRAKASANAPQ